MKQNIFNNLLEHISNSTCESKVIFNQAKLSNYQVKLLAFAITKNLNIEYIDLSNNAFTDNEIEILADAISKHSSIHTLILDCIGITLPSAKSLGILLKHNDKIQILSLKSNNINEQIIEVLVNEMGPKGTIADLKLNGNKISNKGMTSIANFVKLNRNLRTLELANNLIGDQGISILAPVLSRHPSMQALLLPYNKIEDEGSRILADVFSINTFLTTIDLNSNNIGDKGAIYIANALLQNKALKFLNLENNAIEDNGAVAIAEVIINHPTLQSMLLAWNDITYNGANALRMAFNSNQGLKRLDITNNLVFTDKIFLWDRTHSESTPNSTIVVRSTSLNFCSTTNVMSSAIKMISFLPETTTKTTEKIETSCTTSSLELIEQNDLENYEQTGVYPSNFSESNQKHLEEEIILEEQQRVLSYWNEAKKTSDKSADHQTNEERSNSMLLHFRSISAPPYILDRQYNGCSNESYEKLADQKILQKSITSP